MLTNPQTVLRWTEHAKRRWKKRFPHLNRQDILQLAVPPTRRQVEAIVGANTLSAAFRMENRKYLVHAESNVVFVIEDDVLVITTVPLDPAKCNPNFLADLCPGNADMVDQAMKPRRRRVESKAADQALDNSLSISELFR